MEHVTDTTKDTPTDTPSVSDAPQNEHWAKELLRFVLITLVIVVPIRVFIAQPFIVSGASMESTFQNGDYLIVDQLTYHFEEPQRGDVVVFRYPNDPSRFFIKRVIGIPGDTITITGNKITLINKEYPEGVALNEPYVEKQSPRTDQTFVLEDEEYVVFGDNRDESSDSRLWGVLPRENISGRAFVRLFPLGALDLFPGAYDVPVLTE
ncbi:signal peptidase I [Candidatus Kaiserbacteria bacterium]|nr:signal peptidase I [Candidatus Kaiserbacteria bacterium]